MKTINKEEQVLNTLSKISYVLTLGIGYIMHKILEKEIDYEDSSAHLKINLKIIFLWGVFTPCIMFICFYITKTFFN